MQKVEQAGNEFMEGGQSGNNSALAMSHKGHGSRGESRLQHSRPIRSAVNNSQTLDNYDEKVIPTMQKDREPRE